jgi:chromosome partitioning protein
MVDTDPQGSLSDWWNEREEMTPAFVRTSIQRLSEDIDKMRDLGIKLLVIDTPPAITTTIDHVIAVADLVVIPTRPSPHDLRSVGATVDICEQHNKPLVFVINGASARARITTEAIFALSQHGTLAPSIVHQRTDFAASMIDGRTVMEVAGRSKSAREIIELWEYLEDRLMKRKRQPALKIGQMFATAKQDLCVS